MPNYTSKLIADSQSVPNWNSREKTNSLRFIMQTQKQTKWCWAAVATSVALFYDPDSKWTQCEIANKTLGQTNCCSSGATPPCNVSYHLDEALSVAGCLLRYRGGIVDFWEIRDQIDKGRPLGVRFGWADNQGHFVIIEGYDSEAQTISICDPQDGVSNFEYMVFCTRYLGDASWTHSYFTLR